MFYLTAPAGIPISLHDVAEAARQDGCTHSGAEFSRLVGDMVGARYSFDFGSGRAALCSILRSLAMLSKNDRDQVVIPAYTCFSVASAVVRAGLKIRLSDIDPVTLDYAPEATVRMAQPQILAIVVCSLFGLPSRWDSLRSTAAKTGIYLIDDAAQSFGIESDGVFSGTHGDVGFYSFGRGKNLTTYSGGVAVTNRPDIANRIGAVQAQLAYPSRRSQLSTLGRLVAYSAMLRPEVYWLPSSLPFLGIGETVFDPGFCQSRLGDIEGRLGRLLLDRVDVLNSVRSSTARLFIDGLSSMESLQALGSAGETTLPYLRLPVLLKDRKVRDRALISLRKAGIGASAMYPSTMADIPGIESYLASDERDFPGATAVADRLITLPTHPYVSRSDVYRTVAILREVIGSGS